MLEAMDISDLWGTHLFNQAVGEARTQKVGERLKAQLALETTLLLRPFYDLVVSEVAIAGNDLFLREGSDVTFSSASNNRKSFAPEWTPSSPTLRGSSLS